MSYYDKYVALCVSHGKSPSRVALEIGIAKSIVSRWKHGGNPTDATAMKVAEYFGIQDNWRLDEPVDNRVKVRKVRILRKDGLHDS